MKRFFALELFFIMLALRKASEKIVILGQSLKLYVGGVKSPKLFSDKKKQCHVYMA